MSFYYLATVYSNHLGSLDGAHAMACIAAAELMQAGVPVFSPIAHSHFIAAHGEIDPCSYDFRLSADEPFMAAAKALIVYTSPGWRSSVGINIAIDMFSSEGKNVIFWEPCTTIPSELAPMGKGVVR